MSTQRPIYEPLVRHDEPPRPQAPMGTRVAWVALWVVVLALSLQALAVVLPRPAEAWTTTKLEHLAEHGADYDVLFVGSSQVYRHVMPSVFDRVMAEGGHPVRSFNVGIAAMAAVEAGHVLEQLAALDLPRVRWVFLDSQRMGLELPAANHITPRATAWHDLESTWLAVRLIWESEEALDWKLQTSLRHLVSAAYRLGNVGRLQQELAAVLGGTPESRALGPWGGRDPGGLGPRGDGWVSLDAEFREARGMQRRLLRERRDGWLEKREQVNDAFWSAPEKARPFRRRDGSERALQALTTAERAAYERLVGIAEGAGWQPVFINSPDILQQAVLLDAAVEAGVVPLFLDMDDLRSHRRLFADQLRFDENHLNEQGAALYSELLARRFLEQLDAGEGAR